MSEYGTQLLGKVVIDISQKYISVYLCEGDGTVKDSDHFRWPIRLDVKDARQEVRDCFSWFYDYCNDVVNGFEDELQEGDEGTPDST